MRDPAVIQLDAARRARAEKAFRERQAVLDVDLALAEAVTADVQEWKSRIETPIRARQLPVLTRSAS